jgi:KDO2-lipid IV(A) lauroyltransferase
LIAKFLFRLFAKLSLPANHRVGSYLGWWSGLLLSRLHENTRSNLIEYAEHTGKQLKPADLSVAFREQGKGLTELAIAWTAPVERLNEMFEPCASWPLVESAKAAGKPIIFVSPHLGCFDIAGRYVANRIPITAMYRPPKQRWLQPIMEAGRARGGSTMVPADGSGIRDLLRTLKQNGNIMILPDQVPSAQKGGEGVWVPFFGKPAYTMTLLPRLAAASGAIVLFFFAERLPQGRGFRMHFVSMDEPYSDDKFTAARQTNAMVEKLVSLAPEQYLWGYNRYKRPAGAPPAPDGLEAT